MANSIIKITSLPNIGNGLATTSIFPVVANINQTDKVALGDMGNLILTEAGNTLEPAFLSTLAYGVTNAAQPNITSVGTLTSLVVTGNANVGNLNVAGNITDTTGNLAISTIANGNISLTANGTGQIILDGMKWPLTDGSADNVLKTDGAGNLSWVAQTQLNYGNSNVANYLPTYTGNLSPTNLTVTGNSLLGNNSNSGSYFVYRSNTQISIGQVAAQTIDISGNGIQIAGTGGVSLQGAANANIVIGGGTTGNVVFPDGITFSDGSYQNTAANGSGGVTDRLVNGNVEAVLDTSGTLTMPLILPTSFVAVLNSAHCTTSITLTGTPWQFSVQFQVNPDGSVQTALDNPFPQQLNPGYTSGKTFRFTEADHGIPGYTFDITLNSVVQAGPAGWTANPSVTQAPEYPSTFASSGAIKITADANSFVFGTDGTITYPDGTSTDGANITIPITNSYDINTSTLETVSAPCDIAIGNVFVADIEFNDDITVVDVGWTVFVGSNTYTVTAIDPSPPANQYRITAAGATFVQNDTYTFTNPTALTYAWSFGANGSLTLPGNGTISQNNNDLLVQVAGTDIIGLITEGGDLILDADGNVNISSGNIVSGASVSRLSLSANGTGGAYLTSTDDNSTAVLLETNTIQAYAGVSVDILAGTALPELSAAYIDSRDILDIEFTGNELEPGYPWGITLPVSYITYSQLIVLSPGTFTNQAACTTLANNTTNAYELWQDTIAQTNVTVTSNELNWVFDNTGNLILPANTSSINYANGSPYGGGNTGDIGFRANSIYNLDGVIIENADLSHGATSALILPINGNSVTPVQLTNTYGNVVVTTGVNSGSLKNWTFGNTGNLTLPGNTFAVNYANGQQVSIGGGNVSELVNGDNSFVLDSAGNVVFEGNVAGQAVDRGLVWDYGANANGVNSTVRQDNQGITVRAWTENGGGANGYSAPVNIVTNQDPNTNTWRFDGQGNLTLAGNLILPGSIESVNTGFPFSGTITGIESFTYPTPPIITIAEEPFEGQATGQVTISNLNQTTGALQANGTWYYEAVEINQFTLYTDAALTEPANTSTWTAYLGGGGNAVSVGEYTDLTIQGGNVSINSDDNTWTFDNAGQLNTPLAAGSFNTGRIQSANGYPTLLAYGSGSHGGPEFTWLDSDNLNDMSNVTVLRNTMYFSDEGLYVGINENNVANSFVGNWRFDATGNLILPATNAISAPDGETVNIKALDNNGVPSSTILLAPSDTLTRLEQWGIQNSQSFTATDWATGVYTTEASGAIGAVQFTGATNILNFINSLQGVGQIYFSVNGGPQLIWDGSSAGSTNITFYTPTLPATDPTTVTSFEYYYNYNSLIEIDYDAEEFNIDANNVDLTLSTSNQKDIELNSARNMTLIGNGTYSLTNYGNTEGIYITTDANDGIYQWHFDSTGNLTLPQGGVVYETSIPFGGLQGNTIALKPSGGTNADQQLLIYPTAGQDFNHLHLTSGNLYNTELFLGDDNFHVKLANTGNIVMYTNDNIGNVYQLNVTPFGEVLTTGNLLIQTPSGVPNSIANINSQGGYNTGTYTNLSTTGGSGTGLTVNASATGGYIDTVTINTAGSGYTEGDTITIVGGDGLGCTFTVGVSVNTWNFDTDGKLTFPGTPRIDTASNNFEVQAAEAINFEANAAVNIYTDAGNNAYQWNFGGDGKTTLPTISLGSGINEQTVIQSQRKIIPSNRYSAVISGTTPTVVYTANDSLTNSMKVTLQLQHQNLGMEFFEVYATQSSNNTYYTVSNRLQPPAIDYTDVLVDMNGSNEMQITLTVNSGATTCWVTYDSTEFGIPQD